MGTQSKSGYMKFLDMVGASPTYNPPFSTGFGTSESSPAAMQRAAGEIYSAQSMSNKARQRQIEWAIDMANKERATEGMNINNLPDFGASMGSMGGVSWSGPGGAGGGVALRANPYESRLNSLLDNPDSIANTAGYKFEMDQGQQALARSAAAKGMTGSGNTLAALLEHGQGLAATRRGQEVDRLSSLVQGRDSMNANLYSTDVGANTSRYNTDVGANTSRYATDVGSKTSMWNTAQQVNANNYWKSQEQQNLERQRRGY